MADLAISCSVTSFADRQDDRMPDFCYVPEGRGVGPCRVVRDAELMP